MLNDPVTPMSENTAADLAISLWELRESNKKAIKAILNSLKTDGEEKEIFGDVEPDITITHPLSGD